MTPYIEDQVTSKSYTLTDLASTIELQEAIVEESIRKFREISMLMA